MLALAPQPRRPFVPAQAYEALNDVTRRRLLDSLRVEGPATLDELADDFGLARLRVGQHLRILSEAGLIRLRENGGRTFAKYSPVGWARLKTRWERGMTRQLGSLRVAR